MSFFLAILLSMFLGDVLCWWCAHRAARGTGWRWVNAAFFLFQIGLLLLVLFVRARGATIDLLGSRVALAPVYLWHLVLLPLCLLTLAGWAVVSRFRQPAPTVSDSISRRRFMALAAGGGPTILCAGVTTFGLRLLVNESATLRIREADLQLLGLRWGANIPTENRADRYRDAGIEHSMAELARQREENVFPILLAHHPHAFDFAEGIPLTLAGHTHGGQLMLTEKFGAGPAMFRYWSGEYRREDRALIVSNGVGNWLPLRPRAPAEIVHLTLRAA